jgi:adenylyltransferase/sulfurtransferase
VYPTSPSHVDYSKLAQTPFNSKRLRELAVIVVGAGALGNEVARILGLLGTGRVTVVDPDTVEPSNLPRSTFFWDKSAIGQNKAAALVKAASGWFTDTAWAAIEAEIADVGFQKIKSSDLMFSCVDSDLARLEIAYISTKLMVPMMDGGLGRQNFAHGRVTYFPSSRESACYGCLLSPRKRRELLEMWQATLRPCTPATESGEEDLVSTPTMAAVIGALQVEFGLRNFFEIRDGKPVKSNTLEVRVDPDRWMAEFSSAVSVDCPFHDQEDEKLVPQPPADCTVGEFLSRTSADHLILDWPLCTQAKCLACEHKWEPKLRLAALRRRGQCPSCGSNNILEVETIRSVGHDSRWVDLPLAALKLPVDHLYTVRKNAL